MRCWPNPIALVLQNLVADKATQGDVRGKRKPSKVGTEGIRSHRQHHSTNLVNIICKSPLNQYLDLHHREHLINPRLSRIVHQSINQRNDYTYNMSSHSQSYSYSYYRSSTSSNGAAPQTTAYAERSYTDRNGTTTTERVRQLPGQQPVYESSGPAGNRRVQGGASSNQNRITEITDADQKYLERMEDEYAKREGGA